MRPVAASRKTELIPIILKLSVYTAVTIKRTRKAAPKTNEKKLYERFHCFVWKWNGVEHSHFASATIIGWFGKRDEYFAANSSAAESLKKYQVIFYYFKNEPNLALS